MKKTAQNLVQTVALTAAVLLSTTAVAQQGFSSIEERMTGKEFTAAGLEKLTPEQLESLNNWLRAHSVATLENASGGSMGGNVGAVTDARGFENQAASGISDEDIVSAIKGEFSGWTGKTVFELENGMVWKQDEAGTFYMPKTTGAVAVIDKGILNTWNLNIEGYNKTVRVVRVK